jgi:peptidoglycan-N-acetylglucosamine deacetylase
VKHVPVLITWDVDPSPETTWEARQQSLEVTVELCRALGIQTTFFATANAVHVQPDIVQKMLAEGHEIGCHGLTHTDEEEFDRMLPDAQRTHVEEATHKLEALTGSPIRVFRSPRLKISPSTIDILTSCGYIADSSVCSQRIDILSSNLINPGWLRAPRRPYHPHAESVFKRGELPLWEVPVSAAVIPFISAFLSVFGLRFMKGLFRILAAESRRTGKPIVFLGHPIEFTSQWVKPFAMSDLSPRYIRTHGLIIRKKLYRLNSPAWLKATHDLFAYMKSFPDVVFLPVGQYVVSELGGQDVSD